MPLLCFGSISLLTEKLETIEPGYLTLWIPCCVIPGTRDGDWGDYVKLRRDLTQKVVKFEKILLLFSQKLIQ